MTEIFRGWRFDMSNQDFKCEGVAPGPILPEGVELQEPDFSELGEETGSLILDTFDEKFGGGNVTVETQKTALCSAKTIKSEASFARNGEVHARAGARFRALASL
jgi:hypothetical protein